MFATFNNCVVELQLVATSTNILNGVRIFQKQPFQTDLIFKFLHYVNYHLFHDVGENFVMATRLRTMKFYLISEIRI